MFGGLGAVADALVVVRLDGWPAVGRKGLSLLQRVARCHYWPGRWRLVVVWSATSWAECFECLVAWWSFGSADRLFDWC